LLKRTLMRMRTGFVGTMGLGLMAATWSPLAFAQDGDPPQAAGTDVSPGIAVETFWRSNLYLQEGEASGGEAATSGFGIQAKPSLRVETRTQQVRMKLGLGYSARKMIPKSGSSDDASIADVTNLDRFNLVSGNIGLVLLPESVVGVKIADRASLTGRETEAVSATDAYLMTFRNTGKGTLTVRPGSSLELDVGGTIENRMYTLPECVLDSDGCQNIEGTPSLNTRLGYGFVADLNWRFFPRTAVVASFQKGAFSWANNFVNTQGDGLNANELGNYLGVPDGKVWHLEGGLRGRFTEKLVLGAVIGYTSMTYDEDSVLEDAANQSDALDIDTSATEAGFDADLKGFPAAMTANVEAGLDLTEDQRLILSYNRNFEDVFFTNYVGYDRFSVTLAGKAFDRMKYDFQVMYRLESYKGEVDRTDHFIRGAGDLGYVATDWMDITGGVWWTRRASAKGTDPDIEFDDTNVHMGVSLSF
jgi:hypothetical protein